MRNQEGGRKKDVPSDDTCEKEIGMRVADPEQPSVVLLPQTNGFPTILNKQK